MLLIAGFLARRMVAWSALVLATSLASAYIANASSFALFKPNGETGISGVSAIAALLVGGCASIWVAHPGQDLLRRYGARSRVRMELLLSVTLCSATFLVIWSLCHGLSGTTSLLGARNYSVGFATALFARALLRAPGYAAYSAAWIFPALLPGAGSVGEFGSLIFWEPRSMRDLAVATVLLPLCVIGAALRANTGSADG